MLLQKFSSLFAAQLFKLSIHIHLSCFCFSPHLFSVFSHKNNLYIPLLMLKWPYYLYWAIHLQWQLTYKEIILSLVVTWKSIWLLLILICFRAIKSIGHMRHSSSSVFYLSIVYRPSTNWYHFFLCFIISYTSLEARLIW